MSSSSSEEVVTFGQIRALERARKAQEQKRAETPGTFEAEVLQFTERKEEKEALRKLHRILDEAQGEKSAEIGKIFDYTINGLTFPTTRRLCEFASKPENQKWNYSQLWLGAIDKINSRQRCKTGRFHNSPKAIKRFQAIYNAFCSLKKSKAHVLAGFFSLITILENSRQDYRWVAKEYDYHTQKNGKRYAQDPSLIDTMRYFKIFGGSHLFWNDPNKTTHQAEQKYPQQNKTR